MGYYGAVGPKRFGRLSRGHFPEMMHLASGHYLSRLCFGRAYCFHPDYQVFSYWQCLLRRRTYQWLLFRGNVCGVFVFFDSDLIHRLPWPIQ